MPIRLATEKVTYLAAKGDRLEARKSARVLSVVTAVPQAPAMASVLPVSTSSPEATASQAVGLTAPLPNDSPRLNAEDNGFEHGQPYTVAQRNELMAYGLYWVTGQANLVPNEVVMLSDYYIQPVAPAPAAPDNATGSDDESDVTSFPSDDTIINPDE